MLPSLRLRLRALLRRRQLEAELDEELRFHLQMLVEQLVAEGLPPQEARRQAALRFGGLEPIKEACRDQRGVSWLEGARRDLAYAARVLLRSPIYTVVSVLVLAVGIGATAAVFSALRGVLLAPLPFPAGDAVVVLRQPAPQRGFPDIGLSAPEIEDYGRADSLAGIAEYHSMWFNLIGRGEPQRVQTGVVSASYFDLLGVAPLHGRGFLPEDEAAGAPPVLLLSYELWTRQLDADPTVIGESFQMNDRTHVVVGVLPPLPPYPDDNQVYMPTAACPFRAAAVEAGGRRARMMQAFARLRPGVSRQRATSEVQRIAERLQREHPDAYGPDLSIIATLTGLRDELVGNARSTLALLAVAAGCLLLLVSANVANLGLARHLERERELTLRAAIGAGRRHLLRQLLVESSVLALAGGALGIGLAMLCQRLLVLLIGKLTVRAAEIHLDATVLLFALAVSLATGVLVGLLPLLSSRLRPAAALREAGEGRTATPRLNRVRHLLVGAQVAVSCVLVVGASLTLRSLLALERVPAGFDTHPVLSLQLSLDWTRYPDAASRRAVERRTLHEVGQVPGVRHAALALTFPLNQAGANLGTLTVEGADPAATTPAATASFRVVSTDYFATLGIPLRSGRLFSCGDDADSDGVAMVNAALASQQWPDAEALGRRVSVDGGESFLRIVGVVENVRHDGPGRDPVPELYLPLDQNPLLSVFLLVRADGDPRSIEPAVRAAIRRVDPLQPVARVRPLAELRREVTAPPRLTALLLSLVAGLALLVTLAGVGGVVAFNASRRTREIGIRIALGASRLEVLALVTRQGLVLIGGGLLVGLLGALALGRLLDGFLYTVGPRDPATLATTAVALTAVTVVACWLPASRAAAIDPSLALRAE